jgi:hypothetical protein
MKRFIYLFCSFNLIVSSGITQQVAPQVFNTAGRSDSIITSSSGILKIDWSVGEMPLVNTSSATGLIISNGFLHPLNTASPTAINNPNTLSSSEIKIFPNPVQSQLLIRMEMNIPGRIEIILLDISGRKLSRQSMKYSGGIQTKLIDMHTYPSGSYQLMIIYDPVNGNPEKEGNFKVLKN